MYIDHPEHGVKIQTPMGNIYLGWTFRKETDGGYEFIYFFPHFHFTPIDKRMIAFIWEKMKNFFPKAAVLKYSLYYIEDVIFREHGEYGCLLGWPLCFDEKNPRIAEIVLGINEDCDELRHRLKKFLQEIFND